MVANTIYESAKLRVPMVQIAVMRLDIRMLYHNVDDFTDNARVAVSCSAENGTCLLKISQTYEGNSSEQYSWTIADCTAKVMKFIPNDLQRVGCDAMIQHSMTRWA
ncbi:hypothetical protein BDR07DRAFT_369451 [Suillus spraguei]|nr:hypothetical protein BDR07DRAFT_369451 [Suillus spraguei]